MILEYNWIWFLDLVGLILDMAGRLDLYHIGLILPLMELVLDIKIVIFFISTIILQ